MSDTSLIKSSDDAPKTSFSPKKFFKEHKVALIVGGIAALVIAGGLVALGKTDGFDKIGQWMQAGHGDIKNWYLVAGGAGAVGLGAIGGAAGHKAYGHYKNKKSYTSL